MNGVDDWWPRPKNVTTITLSTTKPDSMLGVKLQSSRFPDNVTTTVCTVAGKCLGEAGYASHGLEPRRGQLYGRGSKLARV